MADPEALYRLALRSERHGFAERAFQMALHITVAFPQYVEAHILVGDLLCLESEHLASAPRSDNERLIQARKCFETACETDPQHADAWAGLALVHLELGEFRLALDAALRGLACISLRHGYLGSDYVAQLVGEALYSRGCRAAFGLGDIDRAVQLAADGLRQFPDSAYLREGIPEPVLRRLSPEDPYPGGIGK